MTTITIKLNPTAEEVSGALLPYPVVLDKEEDILQFTGGGVLVARQSPIEGAGIKPVAFYSYNRVSSIHWREQEEPRETEFVTGLSVVEPTDA